MTLPSSVTETPETDSDRVSEKRLREMVGMNVPCVPATPGEVAMLVQAEIARRNRADDQVEYSIHLQRIIEAICNDRPLRDDARTGAPHHYAMAARYRAALRTTPSLPPRSGGLVVKGLEWESRVAWRWTAASLVGNYEVDADSATPGEEFIWSLDREYGGYASTVPAAKAAAQADYEARILSTLADPIPEAPADEEVEDKARALALLAREDERQTKLHDLLETIREQIRLEVAPEHRPAGLMQNIQSAVYAMRGRTALMNDAAITSPLRRSTKTDKPGVREAALEEAAKVADMFAADHAKSADQFGIDRNRELHNAAKGAAQGVAFAIRALSAPLAAEQPVAKFRLGDRVRKIKGSSWRGHVVGTYSTELTPEGYNVESENEPGSVQLYPAAALEPLPRSTTGGAK